MIDFSLNDTGKIEQEIAMPSPTNERSPAVGAHKTSLRSYDAVIQMKQGV
jgi:hypothetical protein